MPDLKHWVSKIHWHTRLSQAKAHCQSWLKKMKKMKSALPSLSHGHSKQNSQGGYWQGLFAQMTFSWPVKIALAWIALLVILAVFAPFLANSVPLIVYGNGHLQFPVLSHLTGEDVCILVVFLSALIMRQLKIPLRQASIILVALLGITALLSHWLIQPPQLVLYDDMRSQWMNDEHWVLMPLVPYSPMDYLRDFGDTSLLAPWTDGKHAFGTESNGSDVLSRMIHAARIALSIGLVATSIAISIGIVIGGLMGHFSGWVDMLGMRLVEIFEAIPTLFLLLTFVAFFGHSIYLMMIIIGITGWSGYARFIRAEFLKLRKENYIQAAIATGIPTRSLLFKHMLPNGIAPLLVGVSFGVASAILAEATLSFLGLGVVEAASWGALLNQAVQSSSFHWWLAFFPGGAIFLTVFAYNVLGEALRDALDPRLEQVQ